MVTVRKSGIDASLNSTAIITKSMRFENNDMIQDSTINMNGHWPIILNCKGFGWEKVIADAHHHYT